MGQHSRVTRTVLGRLALAGLLGLAAVTLMLSQGLLPVPNAVNPFMPLDVRDEPNCSRDISSGVSSGTHGNICARLMARRSRSHRFRMSGPARDVGSPTPSMWHAPRPASAAAFGHPAPSR